MRLESLVNQLKPCKKFEIVHIAACGLLPVLRTPPLIGLRIGIFKKLIQNKMQFHDQQASMKERRGNVRGREMT